MLTTRYHGKPTLATRRHIFLGLPLSFLAQSVELAEDSAVSLIVAPGGIWIFRQ